MDIIPNLPIFRQIYSVLTTVVYNIFVKWELNRQYRFGFIVFTHADICSDNSIFLAENAVIIAYHYIILCVWNHYIMCSESKKRF